MQNRILFAPMEGITDPIYRYYILDKFPHWDFMVTDFLRIPSDQFVTRKLIENHIGELIFSKTAFINKTILQLLFSERSKIEESSKVIEELGLKRLDLNFGCPSKKVNAHGGGAYLLQNPRSMASMVKAFRKHFSGILSAKIRTGYKDENSLKEILHVLQSEGIDEVTIHGRTRHQIYSGVANWKLMEEMAHFFPNLPIIGNGDLKTLTDIEEILNKNLFYGVMIGRGAVANPALAQHFKEKKSTQINLQTFFNDLKGLYLQNGFKKENLLKRFKALAHYMDGDQNLLRSQNLEQFFSTISEK